nr:hypothetical protein [Candidatus Sigynarchaeota archaeon]
MKFGIRVAFSNTGDTGVHSIAATPTFGGYSYLSANSSASISVAAYGTGRIDFSITVGAGATNNGTVHIIVAWTGTEDITNNPVSGGPNTLNVAIQSKANVGITSITCGGLSSAGPFVGGMTFVIRVAFQNTGGTAATGITAAPNYATYPGLSIASGNFSNSITVLAGNIGYIDFLIQVASSAATNGSVLVRSTWTGIEQYSSRALSGASGIAVPPNLNVAIQKQSNVTITGITYRTGNGTYVGGMTFVSRVSFSNTGGTVANSITALLNYGGYTSLGANGSNTIALGVGATGYIDFLVTVVPAAPSQNPVTISAAWSGTEAISSRLISGSSSSGTNLQVAIQAQASVSITSITYRTGAGTYVGGMTFVIRIGFSNTGGTAATGVTAAPNFATYPGLSIASGNFSNTITVPAGSTGFIDFLIQVAASATTNASVLIRSTWAGTEAISLRSLIGNSGTNNLNVAIQAQSNVAITGITYRTGSGTYVGGMTFVIRVAFSNNGGTTANNVVIPDKSLSGILILGISSKYTYNSSNTITITAGGTGFINFLITLDADAPTQPSANISAKWNGTEAISNRPLSGNSGTNNLFVAIQQQANLLITSVDLRTGSGTYVGGM